MSTWKRDISFTGFRTLGRFYRCRIYWKQFRILHHKWVETNRWAELFRKASTAQQLTHWAFIAHQAAEKNSPVCVQTRAQREAEDLVELPSPLSSPPPLFSGSDLSQPLSPLCQRQAPNSSLSEERHLVVQTSSTPGYRQRSVLQLT